MSVSIEETEKIASDFIDHLIGKYGIVLSNNEAAAELLTVIEKSYSPFSDEDNFQTHLTKRQLSAMGMGIEALWERVHNEKYIAPKKVSPAYTRTDHYDFWCPTCHRGIFSKSYDYCPWCGQRLDWNGIVGGK